MKIKTKTKDLTGAALDWSVAKAAGVSVVIMRGNQYPHSVRVADAIHKNYAPSADPVQGHPIIERELIELGYSGDHWYANKYDRDDPTGEAYQCGGDGETTLIAAMRCYVASKLGDELEIPEELA